MLRTLAMNLAFLLGLRRWSCNSIREHTGGMAYTHFAADNRLSKPGNVHRLRDCVLHANVDKTLFVLGHALKIVLKTRCLFWTVVCYMHCSS